MYKKKNSLIVSFLAIACTGSLASAGLVTWDFTGVITAVTDPNGMVTGSVDIGTPFSGSVTFETTTPDTAPGDVTLGTYDGAITDLSGSVNTLNFFGAGVFNSIHVDDSGAPGDTITLLAALLNTPSLGETSSVGFAVADSTGDMFANDSLTGEVPVFEFGIFILETESQSLHLDGTITSIVPEPASLVLLAAGAVPALWRRRKRNHSATT